MSAGFPSSPDQRLAALVAHADPGEPIAPARRWLLVDVAGQQAVLVRNGGIEGTWSVSTAAAGLDAREDSGGTPPGLHAVERLIGAGAEPGAVYVSREPTGEIWRPGDDRDDDLILTRVITLRGLEPGVNAGSGVDSLARYIYLHGTNHEDRIGEPVSHGCIRLRNRDVVELFDLVEEGDPVVIV